MSGTRPMCRGQGVASGTAGPKVAHFDRIEWRIIPDAATVAGALQRGRSTGG